MSLFSIFLYGVGIHQHFMDTTQGILLRVSTFSGLILGVFALYGLVIDIWALVRGGGWRFLPGIGVYLLAGFFGILTAAAAIFIMVLAEGYGG